MKKETVARHLKPDDLPNDQIEWATDKQLARLLNVGVPTIWRWSADDVLPEPHRFGARVTRWRVSEVYKKFGVIT